MLREKVYVRAPPGFPQGKGLVLLLLKAVYGLKQAAKAWYDTGSMAQVTRLASLTIRPMPLHPQLHEALPGCLGG